MTTALPKALVALFGIAALVRGAGVALTYSSNMTLHEWGNLLYMQMTFAPTLSVYTMPVTVPIIISVAAIFCLMLFRTQFSYTLVPLLYLVGLLSLHLPYELFFGYYNHVTIILMAVTGAATVLSLRRDV